MTLHSGERQVTPNISEIRRDHTARYDWAARMLQPGAKVLDFACGIGYGCRIMADAGLIADGIDRDIESIEYADLHYKTKNTRFFNGNGNGPGYLGEYDAVVSFETIEHIEDPRPLLKSMREAAPLLLASVPNEAVFPWQQEDGRTIQFHFRHYTRSEFLALLAECGWRVTAWYGQEGPESEVEACVEGRTLIAVCERGDIPDEVTPGKHIAILGLGPSVDQYTDVVKRQGGRHKFCDEVWTINALGSVFDCDLIFHMDDVKIQEIRAEAAPASNIAAMLRAIKASKVPVMTSIPRPEYPATVGFPLEDALNIFGLEYFNSTAAYAICWAIMQGAAQISIFGMDFTYANTHQAEKGRACVEYWLGQAQARGIKINLPKTTTLLDACNTREERMYGYDCVNIEFQMQGDGTVKLVFTDREKLPTAEEIEKAYDHSAPISQQHMIPRA